MTDTTVGTVRLSPLLHWAEERQLVTPVHVFSPAGLPSAVRRLRDGLGGRISYATKANAHPLMLTALAPLVDEFNVTNPVHLDSVLAAGISADRITYLHPVATRDAIDRAARAGVTRFVIDDERGLDLVLAAPRHGGPPRITLRLRPSGESAGRAVIRFGNTAEALRTVAARAVAAGARVEALAFFVGAHADQHHAVEPYAQGLAQIAKLQHDLAGDGIEVGTVNLGGGFPGARRRFHLRHPDFFGRLGALVRETFPDDTDVVCEPGRYLSEPTMALLTRVIADRDLVGGRMTYVDASGYAGLFEYAFIEPDPDALPVVSDRTGAPSDTRILGPIMDSFDVIKRAARLPSLAEGDLLAFPNTGAYAWSYTAACEGLRAPPVLTLPPKLDALLATEWTD